MHSCCSGIGVLSTWYLTFCTDCFASRKRSYSLFLRECTCGGYCSWIMMSLFPPRDRFLRCAKITDFPLEDNLATMFLALLSPGLPGLPMQCTFSICTIPMSHVIICGLQSLSANSFKFVFYVLLTLILLLNVLEYQVISHRSGC